LNAARAMIRKLKYTANVIITLKDESKRAAADTSLEHPRCRLLHMHDMQPDLYPRPPVFRATKSLNGNDATHTCLQINMACFYWVGNEKLKTVGAAHNKKQAIVQAARNMLQLLASPENNIKNVHKVEYIPPDRSQTPWKCHFCKIFMTGRRPFLSHLEGRCHKQRLSELGMNVDEENRLLRELAEKAFEKTERKKKETTKNASQRKNQKSKVHGLSSVRNISPSTVRSQSSSCPSTGETGCDKQSEEGSEKSGMIVSSSSNCSSLPK